MALELPFGIKTLTSASVDEWYGPYASVSGANATVPEGVRINRTVKIGTNEYWWRDGSGSGDLILKSSISGSFVGSFSGSLTGSVYGLNNTWKNQVKAASNLTEFNLSSSIREESTIDGINITEGDLYLFKDQSDLSKNGIYLAPSGNLVWVRAEGANTSNDFKYGAITFVNEGTTNKNKLFLFKHNPSDSFELGVVLPPIISSSYVNDEYIFSNSYSTNISPTSIATGSVVVRMIRTPNEITINGNNSTVIPYTGSISSSGHLITGSLYIYDNYSIYLNDDGLGNIIGDGTGSINYNTGQYSFTTNTPISVDLYIGGQYTASLVDDGVGTLDGGTFGYGDIDYNTGAVNMYSYVSIDYFNISYNYLVLDNSNEITFEEEIISWNNISGSPDYTLTPITNIRQIYIDSPTIKLSSGICYGDGTFMAVSSTSSFNKIYTTENGERWTELSGSISKSLYDVAYGNGLFVAVGESVAMVSSDKGETWRSGSVPTYSWKSIAYGDGVFAALTTFDFNSGQKVITSIDGLNWTSRDTLYDYANQLNTIVYGNNIFAAIGSNSIRVSYDKGVTWTDPNYPYYGGGIGFGDGKFIITKYSESIFTTDFLSYTSYTNNTQQSSKIIYGEGAFVNNFLSILTDYNNNEINWRNVTPSGSVSNNWAAGAYGNGIYLFLNSTSGSYIIKAGKTITNYPPIGGPGSTTGSFTGSFRGNGSGLTGVNASLPLYLNLSGSISSSLVNYTTSSMSGSLISFNNKDINTAASRSLTDIIIGVENINDPLTSSFAKGNIIIGNNNANNSASLNISESGHILIGLNNLKNVALSQTFTYETIAIGYRQADTLSTSIQNILIGVQNLANTTASIFSKNIAIGFEVGKNSNSVSYNGSFIAIGDQAMYAFSSSFTGIGNGGGNIAIGTRAMFQYKAMGTSGKSIAIGETALFQADSEWYNIAIGRQAGYQAVIGRANVLIGVRAGAYMVSGTQGDTGVGTTQFNVGIGTHTLEGGAGVKGTFVGTEAGRTTVLGIGNSGFGNWSLNNVSGSYNSGLGAFGGYNASITLTGSYNTFIGHRSSYTVGTITDTIVIGNFLNAASSSRIYIGNNTQSIVLGSAYQDNNLTRILVWDSGSTKEIRYKDISSLYTGSYSGTFTGSLLGTASYAVSASWAPGGGSGATTGSFTGSFTGSLLGTASYAISASWAPGGGGTTTGSFTGSFTGSLFGTASFATSASFAISSSRAISASFAPTNTTGSFTGSFTGDGSGLTGIVSSKWTGSSDISRLGNVSITGSFVASGSVSLNIQTTQSSPPILIGSIGTTPSQSLFKIVANAANSITNGLVDIFIGPNNGNGITSSKAAGNITLGTSNLTSISSSATEFSGGRNIAIGWENGTAITAPLRTHNILIGRRVGNASSGSHDYSIYMGYEAGINSILNVNTGSQNESHIILGTNAAKKLIATTGSRGIIGIGANVMENSIAWGSGSGASPIQGTIAIGVEALLSSSFERHSIIIGHQASLRAVIGRGNIIIGTLAGANMVGGTPGTISGGKTSFNVGIGTHTLRNAGGTKNTFVGTEAGSLVLIGDENSGFGNWALPQASGSANSAFGNYSGYTNGFTLTGSFNTFIGYGSGFVDNTIINNTIVIGSASAAISNRIYLGAPNQPIIIGSASQNDNLTRIFGYETGSNELKWRDITSFTINTSSLATTGSNNFIGTENITGSLRITGSIFLTPLNNNDSLTDLIAVSSSGEFFYRSAASLLSSASLTPAGGPVNSIQFNSASAFSGSSKFSYDYSNDRVNLTGSLNATSLTGSLLGTSSYAVSASWAPTNTTGSFTGSFTGSLFGTALFATSASFAPTNTTGSFTGSFTGSLFGTSSWAINSSQSISSSVAISSSRAISASFAPTNTTGSFTGSFTGSLVGTASFATSASFAPTNTTGSFKGSFTGSLFGTASFATSASISQISTLARGGSGSFSGSFQGDGSQLTGIAGGSSKWTGSSNISRLGNVSISGSFEVSGSGGNILGASQFTGPITASIISGSAVTGSLLGTASYAISSSVAISASFAPTNTTGSFTGSFDGSHIGRFSGSLTGSLIGTASYAVSASWAPSTGASNSGSFSGSFQGDGSQLTGIAGGSSKWTGSSDISRLGNVQVSGSFTVTGSSQVNILGATQFTGPITASIISGSSFTGSFSGSFPQLDNIKTGSLGIFMNNGESVISVGDKANVYIPNNVIITGWTIFGDVVGSCVIDVRKTTYSTYPTTSSIAGTEKPTLSSVIKNEDNSLSSWTSSLSSGDILIFTVESISTLTKLNLTLKTIKQ